LPPQKDVDITTICLMILKTHAVLHKYECKLKRLSIAIANGNKIKLVGVPVRHWNMVRWHYIRENHQNFGTVSNQPMVCETTALSASQLSVCLQQAPGQPLLLAGCQPDMGRLHQRCNRL